MRKLRWGDTEAKCLRRPAQRTILGDDDQVILVSCPLGTGDSEGFARATGLDFGTVGACSQCALNQSR